MATETLIRLHLTEKEAGVLRALTGKVSGQDGDNPYSETSAVFGALRNAGVETDHEAYDGIRAFTDHLGHIALDAITFKDRA